MAARLVPLKTGVARPILVQSPVVLVGRHPESDVRIDVPKVSRRHCCLAIAYDRIVVRDLGSRNGLWVNGLRVEEAILGAGDEVAIGPLLYRVETLEPPPVPRPSLAPPIPPAVKNVESNPPSIPFLPIDTGGEDDLIPLDF